MSKCRFIYVLILRLFEVKKKEDAHVVPVMYFSRGFRPTQIVSVINALVSLV
jgi:hypothetical protein